MKKLFIIILSVVIFTSCNNYPGKREDFNVELKSGNKIYKVSRVTIEDNGNFIYVIYPKDSTLSIPEQVTDTRTNGKTINTITTVTLK